MKKIKFFLIIFSFFFFSNCGFEPLYSSHNKNNEELLHISVKNIKDRSGQILKNDLSKKLNPQNEFGRLTIISRMGADKINDYLPQLIKGATSEKLNLLWICDPMHGNTYKTENGFKTRHFNTILKEIQQFFAIHNELGTIPGGVHFELTGDNVTECVGGAQEISDNDLNERYETACDPRLNNEQSLELAFLITELLRKESV